MDRVRIAAHAKTNLVLRVLDREPSGFHRIETLFALLELHDELTVEITDGGISVSTEGTNTNTGPETENLAYRAADSILEATNRPFGVHIRLNKSIPVQAGLGGGSSDGAAALRAVNELTGNVLTEKEILSFAAKLGSDVPFFASRAAFAIGRGRGEKITEVPGPSRTPALIVQPGFGVSTRVAYESLAASRLGSEPRTTPKLPEGGIAGWREVQDLSSNDFEEVLFKKAPQLGAIFTRLERTGPMLTRLCGSGSAMIAIYSTAAARNVAMAGFQDVEKVIPTAIRAIPAPESSLA